MTNVEQMKFNSIVKQNEELFEALKPFADVFQQYNETDHDKDLNTLIDISDLHEANRLVNECMNEPKESPGKLSDATKELMDKFGEMSVWVFSLKDYASASKIMTEARKLLNEYGEASLDAIRELYSTMKDMYVNMMNKDK